MKALRWYGRGDVRLVDVPVPVPGRHEALVEVTWCGVCGSDVEEYLDGPVVIPAGAAPLTLGHEIVGVVTRAAADGSGPAAGTRVVVDVVRGCGECWWCRRHQEGLCRDLVVTGQHVDGGLAEAVPARADRLLTIPDSVSDAEAALAEPLAVAVRAARRCGSLFGRSVLVLGAGTVGQLVSQVIRAGGAAVVGVVDPVPARRTLALRLGADVAFAPEDDHRGWTGWPDRGVDLVVECAGRPGLAAQAIRTTRPGGRAVLVGVFPRPEPVDMLDLVLGEKEMVGSAAHMWDDDVAAGLALLGRGAVRTAELITDRVPLTAGPAAFAALAAPTGLGLKMLIDCRGDQSAEGTAAAAPGELPVGDDGVLPTHPRGNR